LLGRGRAAQQKLRQLFSRQRAADLDAARAHGHKAVTYAKVTAKVVGCVGAFATTAVFSVSAYTLWSVHRRRQRGYTDEFVLTPEDLNMPYQEVQFFTEDGISLTGWFIPQSHGGKLSRRVIVCCHPHNSSKSNLLGVARGLWDRRYSVFMFDFRSFAHTATAQSVGYYEQRDARAAVACARRTAPPGAQIGLIGASMGGAVALMVGHEAKTDAVGVATDCAFASISDVLRSRVAYTLMVPPSASAFFVWCAEILNPLMYGYCLSEVSPITAVAHGERAGEVPLLLIHADDDDIVTVSQGHAILSAAAVSQEDKSLIVVRRCHHIGCFFRNRLLYTKSLVDFFDHAFQAREAEVALASKAIDAPGIDPTNPQPEEDLEEQLANLRKKSAAAVWE